MSAEELQSYADIDPGILTPNMLPSDIRNCFYDHDISILTAGLGGATGSKGIKLFSSASRKMSRGSISIVSMPFSVESENRRKTARETLNDLTNRSDLIICLENDKLKKLVPNMTFDKAFKVMNAILERPVIDLSRVMQESDIKSLKGNAGSGLIFSLGVGLGVGFERDLIAIREAFDSPWLDFELDSVESALMIVSSKQSDKAEISGIAKEMRARVPNANIIFGSYEDQNLVDKLRLSILLSRRLSA